MQIFKSATYTHKKTSDYSLAIKSEIRGKERAATAAITPIIIVQGWRLRVFFRASFTGRLPAKTNMEICNCSTLAWWKTEEEMTLPNHI
jgi:hypothetical protein